MNLIDYICQRSSEDIKCGNVTGCRIILSTGATRYCIWTDNAEESLWELENIDSLMSLLQELDELDERDCK